MSTYSLDRERFIKYYLVVVFEMLRIEVVADDLIKGGEFILDAEQVLHKIGDISAHFWGKQGTIPAKQIKLI